MKDVNNVHCRTKSSWKDADLDGQHFLYKAKHDETLTGLQIK